MHDILRWSGQSRVIAVQLKRKISVQNATRCNEGPARDPLHKNRSAREVQILEMADCTNSLVRED